MLATLGREAELAWLAAEGDLAGVAGDEAHFGPIPANVLDVLGLERTGDGFRCTGSAPVLRVWGTGRPRREFLHVDDLAAACVHLQRHWSDEVALNVGAGENIAIADLAGLARRLVGFDGAIVSDPSKPDGTPQKRLDVLRLAAGWRSRIPLGARIRSTLAWYRRQSAGVPRDRRVVP